MFDGPRLVARHDKLIDPHEKRVCDPAHRPPRGEGRHARGDVSFEEKQLLGICPELGQYVVRLKMSPQSRGVRDIRRLLRFVSDYPRTPLLAAVRTALDYGLFDLERVERMLLRSLARDFFFVMPTPDERDPEDPDDG